MRRLAVLALLMTTSLVNSQTAKDPLRLGRDVTPSFQYIHLEIDPRKPDFSGSTKIELTVHKPITEFRFHARDLKLEGLVLKSAKLGDIKLSHSESSGKGVVTAKAEKTIAPGAYTLETKFSAKFNTQAASLYRMETGGEAYVFTQFESDDARGAFPCWDEPEFKYSFQLSISTNGNVVVTNTPVESQSQVGINSVAVFKKTPPMPTYLLAIAV